MSCRIRESAKKIASHNPLSSIGPTKLEAVAQGQLRALVQRAFPKDMNRPLSVVCLAFKKCTEIEPHLGG